MCVFPCLNRLPELTNIVEAGPGGGRLIWQDYNLTFVYRETFDMFSFWETFNMFRFGDSFGLCQTCQWWSKPRQVRPPRKGSRRTATPLNSENESTKMQTSKNIKMQIVHPWKGVRGLWKWIVSSSIPLLWKSEMLWKFIGDMMPEVNTFGQVSQISKITGSPSTRISFLYLVTISYQILRYFYTWQFHIKFRYFLPDDNFIS